MKWYRDLFEGKPGEYSLNHLDKRGETGREVSFLRDTLKEGYVLDHCCGSCRLAIPLSSERPVVGLDLSRYLLSVAKSRCRKLNVENLDLIRADMRYLPLQSNIFDNVINFWTSFGYFPDEENEHVLNEIARVVKSDGIFVMDLVNPEWIIRNFREKDWHDEETYFHLEHHSLDWETNALSHVGSSSINMIGRSMKQTSTLGLIVYKNSRASIKS
ncbi:MAG: ubiquinone/menaquinone biosynthesis methyltransferase [Candidatus Bathyarchaeota archaeon BA1]|nr:MAG: ubiquinone/menaquinone biosynthesis methyltransferase [Candidatus Bathyarchaeota archaeon BA1]